MLVKIQAIVDTLFTSSTANIILSLLLIHQWMKQYAKEQSIKNNLFSIRKVVNRIHDIRSKDVVDHIDAVLASLGARGPFSDMVSQKIDSIILGFKKDSSSEVSPK